MHGDPVDRIAPRVTDLRARRERVAEAARLAGAPEPEPLTFGMAAYAIVRDTEEEAQRELARITNVSPGSPGFANYQDWVSNTQMESRVSLEDYSVSNRGLRAGFVGTPEQVAERVRAYQDVGVDLLLLQCSPQLEEMERFAETVMPLVPSGVAVAA
jgi:FMNH2-dependent dimethyl sulfone monooxygenase